MRCRRGAPSARWIGRAADSGDATHCVASVAMAPFEKIVQYRSGVVPGVIVLPRQLVERAPLLIDALFHIAAEVRKEAVILQPGGPPALIFLFCSRYGGSRDRQKQAC